MIWTAMCRNCPYTADFEYYEPAERAADRHEDQTGHVVDIVDANEATS